MANIATKRVQREFREVVNSEEVGVKFLFLTSVSGLLVLIKYIHTALSNQLVCQA